IYRKPPGDRYVKTNKRDGGLPSKITFLAPAQRLENCCIGRKMTAIQQKVTEPVSDEMALVQAAKGGDVSAFEELVRRYDRNVFRIAQHITQNREDAEDVGQQLPQKAGGTRNQSQGARKFYPYLVRIAVNEALMRLR